MAAERETRHGGPERVGDILARILAERGLLAEKEQNEILLAWREVVGPRIAAHTKVKSFRGGVLTVGVDSAPLRQELTLFQKDELTRALKVRLAGRPVERLEFTLF